MPSDQSQLKAYFADLAAYSRNLMDRLPISDDIEPIAETFSRLRPALDKMKPNELVQLQALKRPAPDRTPDLRPTGMNTIGILADRLTILTCKEWYLRNRQRRPAEADKLHDIQTLDIVNAMACAQRGHSGLLEKVSSIRTDAKASNFDEAYYGLIAVNILMWETQELLYVRDMESVPAEELRDYIRFFSHTNMLRNAYITQSELLYWDL